MTTIEEVNLQGSHTKEWKFSYRGPALPRGLRVTDGSQWFDVISEGGNTFCIRGSAWRSFVRTTVNHTVNGMVTLYKEDHEDFCRIRVRSTAG